MDKNILKHISLSGYAKNYNSSLILFSNNYLTSFLLINVYYSLNNNLNIYYTLNYTLTYYNYYNNRYNSTYNKNYTYYYNYYYNIHPSNPTITSSKSHKYK